MALDFLAGFVGGCAGVAIGHPFDTVKVKLQTQDYKNPLYRGTWDCFSKIIKKDSVSGLYRGVSSPMAGSAVVNAIVFGVHGNVQRSFEDPDSLQCHFLSGATAGLVQSVVTSPVELLKTRVQISNHYDGVMDCFFKTMKQEGLRGLFKGLGVTAMREFFGCGLYFASYEAMTRSEEGTAPISTATMLLAGGASGIVSWIFTYPLDVVKSRYQADVGKCYSGVFDCLRKSVAREGLAVLTRGLSPTLIRAFPTNAVTFTVVTWIFQLAEFVKHRKEDINKNIESILETFSLNNNIDFIDGSINNVQLSKIYWAQPHRLFCTAGDFWVDGHHDYYFEEGADSNIDQMKHFQQVHNSTNNNLDHIGLKEIQNPEFEIKKSSILNSVTENYYSPANNVNSENNKDFPK